MPRYTPVWLEIPRVHYESLPAAKRRLVDLRIDELLENPTGLPHAAYDEQFAQWSAPLGVDEGFILYHVHEPSQQVKSGALRSRSPADTPSPGAHPSDQGSGARLVVCWSLLIVSRH